MAFEDLKDQFKEQWTELQGKIEENPTYNTLRERYETLSPNAQAGVKIASAFLIAAFLIYFPYSYFSASSDYVAIFNDKRDLIRKLLHASRGAGQGGALDNPPAAAVLVENIRGQLQSLSLLPEQIDAISGIDKESLGGPFAPPEIEQSGILVQLKKLNLKQVVDIGLRLQNMGLGVRLVGMAMTAATPDPHYYDVDFKLARFSLPVGEEPPENSAKGSKRGGDDR